MTKKKQSNRGIWTALVTPFASDGSIDWDAFATLLQRQVHAEITGIVLGGTTGEAPTLRVQEKTSLLRKAKAQVGDRLQIMAGVGSSSTVESIELAKLSRDAGADSLLVVTPPYNKPNDQGMLKHYVAIAESTELPVCLYNVPGRTNQKLSPALMASICQHPRITMVKEASGDISYFSACRMNNTADFLSGDDLTYLASLAVGGVGCISVLANIFPRELRMLTEWYEQGKVEAALHLHTALFPLMEALVWETNPCPLKAALAELGVCKNELRLPLAPITADHLRRLKEVLSATRHRLAEERF